MSVALGNSTVAGAVVMMYDTVAGQWIRPETTCDSNLAAPQRVSASGATLYFVTWCAAADAMTCTASCL